MYGGNVYKKVQASQAKMVNYRCKNYYLVCKSVKTVTAFLGPQDDIIENSSEVHEGVVVVEELAGECRDYDAGMGDSWFA
jgi:hypothetical protein